MLIKGRDNDIVTRADRAVHVAHGQPCTDGLAPSHSHETCLACWAAVVHDDNDNVIVIVVHCRTKTKAD